MLEPGVEIDTQKTKYPPVQEAFREFGIVMNPQSQNAKILWWDGDIHSADFDILRPNQRINKIPGMDFLCYKSSFTHAINQMRRLDPPSYKFFPASFLLPYQLADLQREHNRLRGKSSKKVTWIVKPRNGCCGHGIRLIQHMCEISQSTESFVVQRYIEPFLIDGFKFDFRFYLLISTLTPFTVYIYNEGLARFCTKQYTPPDSSNLSEKFSHLTNTSINVTNAGATSDFTQLASRVLQRIKSATPKGEGLWDRIKEVCMLSMVAMWRPIVDSVGTAVSNRRYYKRPNDGTPELDEMSKYFHICGIDILISSSVQPTVLELNDRPSMVVTFDVERDLKKNLIRDALTCLSVDGTPAPDGKSSKNWERIIPPPPGTRQAESYEMLCPMMAQSLRVENPMRVKAKEQQKIPESHSTFIDENE